MSGQIAILAIGDVFAEAGRSMLKKHLPRLKRELDIDLVVVNAENAAGGIGLIPQQAHEIFSLGVDVITGGNHSLARAEIYSAMEQEPHLLRPANLPPDSPGQGWVVARTRGGRRVAVVNLLGKTFMPGLQISCPFAVLEQLLNGPLKDERHICLDMHAEATSEKQALAWYFDGRISACWGTHTHVPTADERILPKGTAYISDIGMTGPYNSVIGMQPSVAIDRFLKNQAPKFKAAQGQAVLNGLLLCLNAQSGQAERIDRVAIGPMDI